MPEPQTPAQIASVPQEVTGQPRRVVVGGVAMAFDLPARQAFMVEMTSREDLMNAVSLNSSIVNGARVVGPAVAGFLMAHVGMTWCFLLNGLSSSPSSPDC
jgi:MFS family permease